MNMQYNPSEDFELIYKRIHDNCKKLTPGYEQINYLNKIIAECVRFREYELMYEDEIIDDDELKTIMPKVTEHFYSLLEDPSGKFTASENVKDDLVFYHLGNNKQDYTEFFNNVGKLIRELKGDSKRKQGAINTAIIDEADNSYIEKIKIKSSLSDVVRVLEASVFSGIIELQTKVRQFAQMFFDEPIEQISFEKKYNSAKHRIDDDDGSSSNSKALVNFVKIICEDAFKGKEKELNEIISHLQKVKKNGIYRLY